MRFLAFLSVLLLPSSFVNAAEISAVGQVFVSACSYYSGTSANVSVRYRDANLPWGTRVTLIHGLNGVRRSFPNDTPLEWSHRQELPIEAVEGYTWGTTLNLSLGTRTNWDVFSRVAMVFRVDLPNGTTYFDNGGSAWGFYEASIPWSSMEGCAPVGARFLQISTIQR